MKRSSAADELIAAADAGDREYRVPIVLAMCGWIRLARRNVAVAARDIKRAVELARTSDLQAQAAAHRTRAAVALALVQAADLIKGLGDTASAAHARLRAALALAAG
jgi:hypothetical protein